MKNFLLAVLGIAGKVFPYLASVAVVLLVLGGEGAIVKNQQTIQATIEAQTVNQENQYQQTLDTQAALAQADINIAKKLKQLKADQATESDALLKTIYAVDANAQGRADDIVAGVNQTIDSVNSILAKPSYKYLKSITVRLCAKAIDVTKLGVDDPKGWMGTGVIIAITPKYTYVLTNRHVVGNYGDGKYKYYIKDGENRYTLTALKISVDEGVDLALVRIDGAIPDKRAVIGFGTVHEQDAVYMVGMDLGRPFFYSEGTVSGFDPTSNDELVVGMPVGPGNSGSAVINQQGALVGLLYAGSIIDQDGVEEMDIAHGLCVPVKAIRLFLAGFIQQ
jgi:S1-C subfamily serine protease